MAKSNKRNQNVPAKQYTDAEVRKRMTTTLLTLDNPAVVLKQLGELLSRMDSGEGVPEDGKGIADETIGKGVAVLNLDTHYLLSIATKEQYRSYSIELATQLIAEYDCKTASEKALAQLTAQAHVRALQYAQSLNNAVAQNNATPNLNVFFAIMSKEIDRANRQFIAGLTTLKQIKNPAIAVTLKTQAAFIAQNQQFNAGGKDETN
jgi:hypothetical protein